ncbi:MAG: selenide, water dikinase SelD [Paludibacterium sp.]|uniref:selenide, water dikinase SelD n=1 Tax=Paludibacterium sp. TaxID=1917523 RepID=UPI0025F893A9|nr:selenide, water dikinase SelD [Paludibacterium sp.]MBV8048229.1 selenide, water dikinase SelD [Paludibacterium sp.]MBV8469539.1 selenide, water dikinase SelD [Burkholderiaceae bacterium]MBV8647101.1 selenide, water dikinase SelD [Paludibacterium sp.]
MADIKLTQLSHGGGCGCKIAPAVLQSILAGARDRTPFPDLLVGAETSDDAAVYRLNDQQAIVATTDFFMPIVDDARDFGRIAATNALSDIYAMGATPIMALAIVGMPVNTLPLETIRAILAGGESVCMEAGIPLAGGHSIDAPEPIYGLVALGVVHPDQLKRNSAAREGDVLILGKPLGIGILAQAMKKGLLDDAGYRALIDVTTRLNRVGSELARLDGVHALTDVTGFGLLGHLLELCRGASLGARLDMAALPVIAAARAFAEQGIGPGAIERNLQSFADALDVAPGLADWQIRLLADPQTSGGLLASVAPSLAEEVLSRFHAAGFAEAAVVGRLTAGAARVAVS